MNKNLNKKVFLSLVQDKMLTDCGIATSLGQKSELWLRVPSVKKLV